MRRRATRKLAALAALACAFALVSCSGGGDSADNAAPAASPSGVAATACPSPAAPAATAQQQTVTVGTTPRTYYVWTPIGYDGTKPAGLVVDYHGTGGEAVKYSTTFSGMVRDALPRNYIVVAPQAVNGVWSAPGYDGAGDDVTFTKQIIDTVSSTYCVDPARVYASGFSLGGGFTNYISCVLDVFAAVAPEGGVNFARPCANRPPTAVIAWHGANDLIAAYGDDAVTTDSPVVAGENYTGDVPYVMDQWAVRNQCQPARTDTKLDADVTKRTYACPAGQEVELYVHSGGHTLPGSITLDEDAVAFRGPQVMSINAPTVTLDFFDAHRRTRAPATAPAATDAAGQPTG